MAKQLAPYLDTTMQFHILSFEGPDPYARAGGIASRITGLSESLAEAGFETHLWFIGDPALDGHETCGNLHLRRWCQWISQHHPGGVYDGEEVKRLDYVSSLPPFLMREHLLPHLRRGGHATIFAEEWQTVDAVLHLDWLLRCEGLRQQVTILWNANNTFSFDRIDWGQLANAAVITTVSRYMKRLMHGLGVDPLVLPNGLSADAFLPPDKKAVVEFHKHFQGRTVLTKVARWDPDKRWLLAVDTVAAMKQQGWRPLFIARGGVEAHGAEVFHAATAAGLRVVERTAPEAGVSGLVKAMADLQHVDMVHLRSPIDATGRRALFHSVDAVLANSGHEPFGLVGLEAMAAGGVACTGCSGEDYAMPGQNALVLETSDPHEFISLYGALRANPAQERAMRLTGQWTARRYAWPQIIAQLILPRLQLLTNITLVNPHSRAQTHSHAA